MRVARENGPPAYQLPHLANFKERARGGGANVASPAVQLCCCSIKVARAVVKWFINRDVEHKEKVCQAEGFPYVAFQTETPTRWSSGPTS